MAEYLNKKSIDHKIIFARLFLSLFFFVFFPVIVNAGYCVSTSGTPMKTIVDEVQCTGTGNNWVFSSGTGLVNCNIGGSTVPTSVSECSAMHGTVKSEGATVKTPASSVQSTAARTFFMPGINKDSTIADYVKAAYNYALGVVGIIATIVIMIAGLIWITSMGNASRVTDAKDWIGGALTGLALAMFSYSLLWIINPDLVTFQPLNVTTIGAPVNGEAPKATTAPVQTKCNITCGECTKCTETGKGSFLYWCKPVPDCVSNYNPVCGDLGGACESGCCNKSSCDPNTELCVAI